MKYILIFTAIYLAISLYPKFRRTVTNMYNYKKPTETYSQNTYVKKKLDLKTNKLVIDED